MGITNDNEVWVFLSHSNKDYEKVRQVRNMLEERSLRPLMFFLHCLNDDDEIDTLIKREIDCRTRFILCDSENARKSHWVQKEVEYIKSQNRICETIDLSKSINEIAQSLQDFINKTRIFISYNREEFELAEMVYKRLRLYDFSVYIDRQWDSTHAYTQDYHDTINFLASTAKYGYVISITNERILNFVSGARAELVRVILENRELGFDVPNIIPFVKSGAMIGLMENDSQLYPLKLCGIRSLEKFGSKTQQCDEIIKTVVTRLMTPGSIRVQAANFEKGISCQPNPSEAAFLNKVLNQNAIPSHLISESGTFYLDANGIVERFEPTDDNVFVGEDKVTDANGHSYAIRSIKTLIVPHGVKGFCSDFMRRTRVVERFELPEGLESIGGHLNAAGQQSHCVFANCILPLVRVPDSVRDIGDFAFGACRIDTLQLSSNIRSPYRRQFKDSYIGCLQLPVEWKDKIWLTKGRLDGFPYEADEGNYGYLHWPSTHVERLNFY